MINVEELAAQALSNYEPLINMLYNKKCSIYHDNAPEDGNYPLLQYTDLSENPVLHADDKAIAFEKVIRVTIIMGSPVNRHELKEAVMKAMVDAGFMWQMTDTLRVGREYYVILDFSYGSLM